MSESCSTLTVYFEDPFWVGIYERQNAGKLEVCKIVYGPEPKIYEVYEHLLTNWYRFSFSPPVDAESSTARALNPKRLQRQVKRAGTMSVPAPETLHDQHKDKRDGDNGQQI